MNKKIVLSSFLSALLMSSAAYAAPAQVPSSVLPGRVGAEITKSVETRQKIQTPSLPDAPLQTAPKGAEKIKLTLKKVELKGNSTLSTETLSSVYAADVGKTISLARVYDIANEITAKYRNNGFLLSRAIVPQQEIAGGTVKIQIIEGFVDKYTLQGETRGMNDKIKAYADKIVGAGTLNSKDLERYLLLMNDLPGVTVRGVLSPSTTTPGAADLTLVATEKRVDGSVSADNFGNAYLGPARYTGQINVNSPFKIGDKLSVTYLTSPHYGELNYIFGSYAVPVGHQGTTAGVSTSYTRTNPSLPASLGGSLGTQGESNTFSLFADHPLIRSRAENLFVGASFDFINDKTNYDAAFSALETNDRVRVAKLKSTYSLLDRFSGYNTVAAELAEGFDIFGSTGKAGHNLSRNNGDDQFIKFSGEATRLQQIYGKFSGLFGVTGQIADDSLLAGQEFGFGGPSYGRGYDISEITGDNGVATKMELIYSQPVNLTEIEDYQLYTFYDFGKVWNKNVAAGDERSESAASAGLGTRVTFTPRVSGDAYVAVPLTRPVASKENHDPNTGNDVRFKFSLTGKF